MPRIAEFVATVGTLLIENHPFVPWQAPVPPALAEARGWFQRSPAGPVVFFVMGIDGRPLESVEEAVAQWRSWLEALHAAEAVLLLVGERGHVGRLMLGDEFRGVWQVWVVDLEAQRLEEGMAIERATPFMQAVDGAIAAYFGGTSLKAEDLAEVETARLAGRVPFLKFLASQRSPATTALLTVIVLAYLATEALGGSNDTRVLLRVGANYRPLVEEGEAWRLVSANFLHIGWQHLLVNGVSLLMVGPTLEKLFGSWKFLAIFIVAGLTGAIASLWLNANGATSAGASGALFGLIGAVLILGLSRTDAIPPRHKKTMRLVAAANLILILGVGFQLQWVDNYAHMGGLLGGSAMAALLGPSALLRAREEPRWLKRLLAFFPLVAIWGLGSSAAYVLSGQTPSVWSEGPTRDYVLKLPITMAMPTEKRLYLSADRNEHWVSIESMENPSRSPDGGRVPLIDQTLEQYAPLLAARFVNESERLNDPPRVMAIGGHRFLQLQTASGQGQREEVYLTASRDRLYVIRTRGLATVPWVRPTLQQVLNTFNPIRVEENPHGDARHHP